MFVCFANKKKTGREKLGYEHGERVRLVLESDGTEIDDDYLKWLPDSTTLVLLRSGEQWSLSPSRLPTPIPRVVCDALSLLEVRQEPPFWKIVDNRGRVTLVLHWDQDRDFGFVQTGRCHGDPHMTNVPTSASVAGRSSSAEVKVTNPGHSAGHDSGITIVSEGGGAVTTLRSGRLETLINNVHHSGNKSCTKDRPCAGASRSTVADTTVASGSAPYRLAPSVHLAHHAGAVATTNAAAAQHAQHGADECEFHCGSLHEKGRQIRGPVGALGAAKTPAHVRFQDSGLHEATSLSGKRDDVVTKADTVASLLACDDSESEDFDPESSNTVEEDGGVTTEKVLLLIDQLSADQRKHLTILDLGVILDRLKTKIIDVKRLEREREGPGCFRWMIKATIRGDGLRDLGVLYNGNYYSISEHQHLNYAAIGFEDDEDREDPV